MSEQLDVVLSLLQVNVALGILYIGLEAARYRNKLHRNIVSAVGRQTPESEQFDANSFKAKILDDETLTSAYRYVSTWLVRLPSEYADQIKDTPVWALMRNIEPSKKAPKPYNWYRSNWDRRSTFAICTMLSIANTFALLWLPLSCIKPATYFVIFLGLAWVSGNVALGEWMSSSHSGKFDSNLESLIESLEFRQSKKNVTTFELPENSN